MPSSPSFQGITGAKFLDLSKEDILKLVNHKYGPCLKVENLLTLLKARIHPGGKGAPGGARKLGGTP